jgi:hypothetical protein
LENTTEEVAQAYLKKSILDVQREGFPKEVVTFLRNVIVGRYRMIRKHVGSRMELLDLLAKKHKGMRPMTKEERYSTSEFLWKQMRNDSESRN